MSLDAFNYTKGALLYAFCYGVYVKQLCSPWTGERKRLGVTEKVDPIIYKLAEFRSLYFDTPVQTMQTKGYDFMPDLSTVVIFGTTFL